MLTFKRYNIQSELISVYGICQYNVLKKHVAIIIVLNAQLPLTDMGRSKHVHVLTPVVTRITRTCTLSFTMLHILVLYVMLRIIK